MAKNLIDLSEILLEELGENDVDNPSTYTNDDVLYRSIIRACMIVDDLVPSKVVSTINLSDNVNRYTPPAGHILIVAITIRDGVQGEYPLNFVYEAFDDKINILSMPIGSSVAYVYHTKAHTHPTETVASSYTDKQEAAIILLAINEAVSWRLRKTISQNKGVMEFTVGRYSEKSGASSVDALNKVFKMNEEKARKLLGADDGAHRTTNGNNSGVFYDDFKTENLTDFGYDGLTSFAGRNLSVPSGK